MEIKFVEDLIEYLDQKFIDTNTCLFIKNDYDRRTIRDLSIITRNGNSISTSQSLLMLRLISKYKFFICKNSPVTIDEIDNVLNFPQHRLNLYVSSVVEREVRYIGNNALVFRCKYNPIIKENIKLLTSKKQGSIHPTTMYPFYNKKHRVWVVYVSSENIEKVMEYIKRHNFKADEEVETYFLDSLNSMYLPSSITLKDNKYVIEVQNDPFLNQLVVTGV